MPPNKRGRGSEERNFCLAARLRRIGSTDSISRAVVSCPMRSVTRVGTSRTVHVYEYMYITVYTPMRVVGEREAQERGRRATLSQGGARTSTQQRHATRHDRHRRERSGSAFPTCNQPATLQRKLWNAHTRRDKPTQGATRRDRSGHDAPSLAKPSQEETKTETRQDTTGQGVTGEDKARQRKASARRDKKSQRNTRQDKTRDRTGQATARQD